MRRSVIDPPATRDGSMSAIVIKRGPSMAKHAELVLEAAMATIRREATKELASGVDVSGLVLVVRDSGDRGDAPTVLCATRRRLLERSGVEQPLLVDARPALTKAVQRATEKARHIAVIIELANDDCFRIELHVDDVRLRAPTGRFVDRARAQSLARPRRRHDPPSCPGELSRASQMAFGVFSTEGPRIAVAVAAQLAEGVQQIAVAVEDDFGPLRPSITAGAHADVVQLLRARCADERLIKALEAPPHVGRVAVAIAIITGDVHRQDFELEDLGISGGRRR